MKTLNMKVQRDREKLERIFRELDFTVYPMGESGDKKYVLYSSPETGPGIRPRPHIKLKDIEKLYQMYERIARPAENQHSQTKKGYVFKNIMHRKKMQKYIHGGTCSLLAIHLLTGQKLDVLYRNIIENSHYRVPSVFRGISRMLSGYIYVEFKKRKAFHILKHLLPNEPIILSFDGHMAYYDKGILYDRFDSLKKGKEPIRGFWVKC